MAIKNVKSKTSWQDWKCSTTVSKHRNESSMVAKPLFQGWQPSWKSILSIADNLLSPNTVVPCRESWCKSQDISWSKSQFSHCLPTSSKYLTAEKVSGEHSLCSYPLQQCYSNKKHKNYCSPLWGWPFIGGQPEKPLELCAPSSQIHMWSPHPQDLRMWQHLEIGPLKRWAS